MGVQVRIEEVGQDKLDRINAILSGVGRGEAFERALNSAFKRASDAGKTEAARATAGSYTITQAKFKQHTRISTNISGGASSCKVEVMFAGEPIPLIEFSTTGGQQGNVKVAVKRGPKKPLEHAWKGLPGLHIWERVGSKRLPIEKLYGPSTPQMLQDEGTGQRVMDRMSEEVEKRLEHEINRILLGR